MEHCVKMNSIPSMSKTLAISFGPKAKVGWSTEQKKSWQNKLDTKLKVQSNNKGVTSLQAKTKLKKDIRKCSWKELSISPVRSRPL